ncbi:hypothetical protein P43SY_001045 [Pythium insidiosum]|uniref:Uncharacterized protein n=1 Tax=Pythium insidiosum TaxID=114742 RepID=A0AAD5Q421_PYTIN|nr:hypothetical protein P43SY_001045 [Pythium insidiosum]
MGRHAKIAAPSVPTALQAIAGATEDVDILLHITALYEQVLASPDERHVVAALRQLHERDFLLQRVWRVRAAAVDAQKSSPAQRKGWLLTLLLLLATLEDAAAAAWPALVEDAGAWQAVVAAVLDAAHGQLQPTPTPTDSAWSFREKAVVVQFLTLCFARLDVPAIAQSMLPLVALPMWSALSPTQRRLEFQQAPKLERHWRKLDASLEATAAASAAKKRKTDAQTSTSSHDRAFVSQLVDDLVETLRREDLAACSPSEVAERLRYAMLVLTLLLDLLQQLPTRRFLAVVLRRKHLVTRLRHSALVQLGLDGLNGTGSSPGVAAALRFQLERVEFLVLHAFVDGHTGQSIVSRPERQEIVSTRIRSLQLMLFQQYRGDAAMEALAVQPMSSILDRDSFRAQLSPLAVSHRSTLEALGCRFGVFREEETSKLSDEMLVDCFVDEFSVPSLALQAAKSQARILLPTETTIWNDALTHPMPVVDPACESLRDALVDRLFAVAPGLPRLGLQYLNLSDWLQRQLSLSRVELSHVIRADLERAIRCVDAVRSLSRNGETVFRGFAQHAAPLETALTIKKVDPPRVGQTAPATVIAEFDVSLDTRHDASAFDRIDRDELVYLVALRPTRDEAAEVMGYVEDDAGTGSSTTAAQFAENYGVWYVRCAQIVEVLDSNGVAIQDTATSTPKGRTRTFKVALNGEQYKKDLDDGTLAAYEYVNLLVRTQTSSSAVSAIDVHAAMKAIASLASRPTCETESLPSWLYDLVLGYGDPSSATYESILRREHLRTTVEIPMHRVFVDGAHAVECISAASPAHKVTLVDVTDMSPLEPTDATDPWL